MAAPKTDKDLNLLDVKKVGEATANHRYNKVPSAPGKGLKISSAEKHFKKNPTAIFVPIVRLVGDEAAVAALLARSAYARDAAALLSNGYSLRSLAHPELRARFDAEVAAAKAHKEAKYQSAFTTGHLRQWHAMGKPQKVEKATGSPRAATGSPRGGGHGRPVNLAAAIAAAVAAGAVRNVSEMTENGAHSKKQERRTDTKFKELPEVPGLVSDSLEKYVLALRILGKTEAEIANLSAKFAALLQPQMSMLNTLMPIAPAPIVTRPVMPFAPQAFVPQAMPQTFVPQVQPAANVSPRSRAVAPIVQPFAPTTRTPPRVSPAAPIVPPIVRTAGTSPRITQRSPARVVQPVVQSGPPSSLRL